MPKVTQPGGRAKIGSKPFLGAGKGYNSADLPSRPNSWKESQRVTLTSLRALQA